MINREQRKITGIKGGYAIVTSLIFFLAASVAVITGLSDSVFREVKTIGNESASKQAYYTSESALEDIIYRIKKDKIYGDIGTFSLATGTAAVSVISGDEGIKEIRSEGEFKGIERNTEAVLKIGQGVSFTYALQAGFGGVDLAGGSGIVGDVYTTGSLRGCGTCTVSGEAVAVGKNTNSLDQDNSLPSTPSGAIIFGNNNSTQDIAQSFSLGSESSILHVAFYIKKVGNPSNATVRITTDGGTGPSGTVLASGTLSSSLLSTSFGWMDISLTSNPVLVSGTKYWIVIDAGSNSGNYYSIASNSVYSNGEAKIGRFGSSWSGTTPPDQDIYFQVYSGTNEIGITGGNLYNPITVGSAYAYNVSFAQVSGSLYCQSGTGNNKSCDPSRGDPPQKDYPVPSEKINNWKAEAETSVYNDDYQVGWAGAMLGPKKINGNLTVSGGGKLRVSGTLWVTGDVAINGGSTVEPFDETKSYVIIANGTIFLSGSSKILGNHDSHILLLSLSTSDPAISITGGANDTVIFAPAGGLYVSGGAAVKAGSAKHISVDGGSSITYDPDLANLNFASGIGDLDFHLRSWKEVE